MGVSKLVDRKKGVKQLIDTFNDTQGALYINTIHHASHHDIRDDGVVTWYTLADSILHTVRLDFDTKAKKREHLWDALLYVIKRSEESGYHYLEGLIDELMDVIVSTLFADSQRHEEYTHACTEILKIILSVTIYTPLSLLMMCTTNCLISIADCLLQHLRQPHHPT